MASINSHETKYVHNKKFIEQINEKEYPDWKIIAYFYCSLHKVNKCMHYVYQADDADLENHTVAREFVNKHNITIGRCYARLLNLSYLARYDDIDLSGRISEAKKLLNDIERISDELMREKARELIHKQI